MLNKMEETKFYLETLKTLVSTPTAPFHEERVCRKIIEFLQQIGVDYQLDKWGNIIAHYQKGQVSRPIALMAHTDHPAFELTEIGAPPEYSGANWTATLLGGVSAKCFEKPSQVKLFRFNSDEPITGVIVGHSVGASAFDITLYLYIAESAGLELGDFGIWDLPDFELSDGFIHARVIDDLVGCAATLLALWKLVQSGAEADVYGVFTRAEEEGLIGAELLLQSRSLPENCFVFSLEASKALPGAVQGEGPVIRTGDRVTSFSEQAEFILKMAADRMGSDIVKRRANPVVKVQRQLMSGGRCEGSAAAANNYIASGLAFPLGNYHNVAADFTLQPENIHEQDFFTGIELLYQAAILMPQYDQLFTASRATANQAVAKYESRLINTATNIK